MIDPLIIKCPKCGHTNRASAINCENCHINLGWARANQPSFEMDEKQEQQMDFQTSHTRPANRRSIVQNNLSFFIFFTIFVLIIVFGPKTDWICNLPVLLLFGVWFWFVQTYERNQETELEKIWSELARETGLKYIPRKGSFLSSSPPRVRGEYRGVYLSIDYVIEGGGGEYDAPVGFTKIMLLVRNRSRFSLKINDEWIFLRRFRKHYVLSGNEEFDQHFRVRGAPMEFVHKAIRLTGLPDMLLFDESQSKMMKNPYPLSWSGPCRPSIKLDGSDLICMVHGVYKLVSVQTDMLNMLCDLAQLVEQMGREHEKISKVRN